MSEKKRTIIAEDLYNFELLSGMALSPDGDHVIYAQNRIDPEKQKKYSNLWLIATRDKAVHQFTYGDQLDHDPRWSPDNSQIAFLSNRKDEKEFQIYLIPFRGGEARPITDLEGEFGSFEWSPDGSKIVCQFRKKDAETIAREADENLKKLGIVQRHIDRLTFKYDGAGFLPKERWHLWVVDAKSGEATQLTDGAFYDEHSPTWSPDGRSILFTSNRSPNPDIDYDLTDLYLIPADGGEMLVIATPPGGKAAPSFSPDGKLIAYLAMEKRGEWWRNNNLWVVPVDGSSPARNLTAEFDFNISPDVINDMNAGAIALEPPTWSLDRKTLTIQVGRHGSSALHTISLETGELGKLTETPGTVGVFNLDDLQTKIAYFFSTMTDPGQIRMMDLISGDSYQLTNLNPWLGKVDLGHIEEIWFQGRDSNDLQGWILKPPGFDPTQKYPSILEIHGGPMAQYGHNFMHEFYFLAAQGYVVYFSNPRGGLGYGETHTAAIWGNWGDADYADLMLWADYVKALPYIDPARMGVTGGSYGGYMTLWMIGHTHQFQAAVAQRVVSNFISMWGSSDMNWKMQHLVGDPAPIDDIETAWNHSPVKYLGNATTPTLIIHSEEDHRCPIEQGEQAFVSLKVHGVDTEMVRFPGEPHGLSRTGRTDRRIARLNHILRWMDKYLKDQKGE
jgi:dipeptidyl aminopeptidase/acylaminoacyl peptidase